MLRRQKSLWSPRSICKPCRVQHCSVCDNSEYSCGLLAAKAHRQERTLKSSVRVEALHGRRGPFRQETYVRFLSSSRSINRAAPAAPAAAAADSDEPGPIQGTLDFDCNLAPPVLEPSASRSLGLEFPQGNGPATIQQSHKFNRLSLQGFVAHLVNSAG